MQNSIKLTIPTPCYEKWDSFTKTTQGGFCGSCQKEVIDFTTWSEEQIKAHFKKPALHTCGRFKQEQLKVYTLEQPTASKINWLSFALVSLLMVFSSRQTSANTVGKVKPHTEQLQPGVTMGEPAAIKADSAIVLRGKVRYAGDSSALPGVNVTLKGKTTTLVTDANGDFILNDLSPSDTIAFHFVGMLPVEYAVSRKGNNEITIMMEDDNIVLGGSIVVGGVVGTIPWHSPKRWWWGIKSCFRK